MTGYIQKLKLGAANASLKLTFKPLMSLTTEITWSSFARGRDEGSGYGKKGSGDLFGHQISNCSPYTRDGFWSDHRLGQCWHNQTRSQEAASPLHFLMIEHWCGKNCTRTPSLEATTKRETRQDSQVHTCTHPLGMLGMKEKCQHQGTVLPLKEGSSRAIPGPE